MRVTGHLLRLHLEVIKDDLMAFNIQNIGHQIANDVKIQINREFLSKFPDKD